MTRQMERVEADGVEGIARRHLANYCNEVCAQFNCTPANAVALMMKECADGFGEIDEGLTRRYLRLLHEAYSAKVDGNYKANVKRMTQLALVIEDLVLLEIQEVRPVQGVSMIPRATGLSSVASAEDTK